MVLDPLPRTKGQKARRHMEILRGAPRSPGNPGGVFLIFSGFSGFFRSKTHLEVQCFLLSAKTLRTSLTMAALPKIAVPSEMLAWFPVKFANFPPASFARILQGA